VKIRTERFRGFLDVLGTWNRFRAWSVSGLIADFVGVSLLGIDLICVQRMLRLMQPLNLTTSTQWPKNTEVSNRGVRIFKKNTRCRAGQESGSRLGSSLSHNNRKLGMHGLCRVAPSGRRPSCFRTNARQRRCRSVPVENQIRTY
jgi:hypothetical protein